VLCGIDSTSGDVVEAVGTFAADMRLLAKGMNIQLPGDEGTFDSTEYQCEGSIIQLTPDPPSKA